MAGNFDAVNHPSHYTDGEYECIDFIEQYGLGFHVGNAVKYISRAGKKDPRKEIEDLQKAIWYLRRAYQTPNHYPSRVLCNVDDPISISSYCKDKSLPLLLARAMHLILIPFGPDSKPSMKEAIAYIEQYIKEREVQHE